MRLTVENSTGSVSLSNFTDDEVDENDYVFSTPSQFFLALMAVLISLTNGFVINLIYRTPSLRKTSNNILASLAVADLLTGIVGIPLIYCCSLSTYGPICISSTLFIRYTSISTSLHILAVSGDRYVAIVHTLRYEEYLHRFYGKRTLKTLWVLPLVVSLIQLAWIPMSITPLEETLSADVLKYNIIYHFTCMCIFYVCPFMLVIFIYIVILQEVKRQREKTKKLLIGDDRRKSILRRHLKERRAVLIFLALIITHAIFWLPYYAIIIQHHFGNELFSLPEWLENILYKCRFASSFMNPILYSLGKLDLRKAAIKQFLRILKSRESLEQSERTNLNEVRKQRYLKCHPMLETTV